MKAVVFNDIGDIRLEEVEKPKIKDPMDAVVKITCSAICGTDLHFIRGTISPMEKGTILGHEAVGIIEQLGKEVRNFQVGDRVIVPSTIACGYCQMCRKGFYSQCNVANPNGLEAGTAFFGGPKSSGPIHGCQAEFVRVPFANNNLIKLDPEVSDDKAILLSDIFPTAYFAADMAQVQPGKIIVILGCGPVGLFTIISCQLMGASRIYAVDSIPSRLEAAKALGAEVINFNEEDPLTIIKESTKGTLADIVIDAVGVDAVKIQHDHHNKNKDYSAELNNIAPKIHPKNGNWIPGDAPSQALRTGVDLVSKCGTISIIGVYPETAEAYPIGKAMNKNLKIVMGNCPHRYYIPSLLKMVKAGVVEPNRVLTHTVALDDIITAYHNFDARQQGWIKVAIKTNS